MKKKPKNNSHCYYIAGKVTGEDYLKVQRKFNDAEHIVVFDYGAESIINPTKLCKVTWSWYRCMAVCLYHLIFKADVLYLLNDWNKSRGCGVEVFFAILTRKLIVLQ